jgi:hypothetical protein
MCSFVHLFANSEARARVSDATLRPDMPIDIIDPI